MSLSPKEYAPRSGNPQGNVKHSSANKKFVWETLNWVQIPSDKPPRQNQFRVRGYVPTWTTSLREDNQYHIMGPRPHWALGLVHSRTPNGGESQYLNLISSWHRTFNNLSQAVILPYKQFTIQSLSLWTLLFSSSCVTSLWPQSGGPGGNLG